MNSQDRNSENTVYRFPVPQCLSERDIAEYVSRAREGNVDEAVRDHLVKCPTCRIRIQQALVSEAHSEPTSRVSRPKRRPKIARRTSFVALIMLAFAASSIWLLAKNISSDQVDHIYQTTAAFRAGSPDRQDLPNASHGSEESKIWHRGGARLDFSFTRPSFTDSRPLLSKKHGENAVLVIEIGDFPHVLRACETCLAKLHESERERLNKWEGSPTTIKRMFDKNAFMLLEPKDHDILLFLFDRRVIATTSDRHRIFARIGEAFDTGDSGTDWGSAQNLIDFSALFAGLPGFKSLSNMNETERLEYILESVDVPILIVHSLEHADLGRAETNNFVKQTYISVANFLE